MPSTIPLTHLVLYKHGVGTFTRTGVVDDTELELPFRSTEVDDALKSLVVRTLAGIPIELGHKHSLFELLRSLRGSTVELRLDYCIPALNRTGRRRLSHRRVLPTRCRRAAASARDDALSCPDRRKGPA